MTTESPTVVTRAVPAEPDPSPSPELPLVLLGTPLICITNNTEPPATAELED